MHAYFNPVTRVLRFSEDFLSALAAQDERLAIFVHGARTGDRRLINHGWNAYYQAFGDGEEACLHLTAATTACGGRITDSIPRPGLNCALFALGSDIGAAPSPPYIGSQDTMVLYRALVGAIAPDEHGRNQAVMLPCWRELLPDLGYRSVEHGIPGDVAVYTIESTSEAAWIRSAADKDLAVHYGRVRQGSAEHMLVESKSGVTFPTYLHPLHAIDPTYLTLSPVIRVFFFRRTAPRLAERARAELVGSLARKYRARLSEFGVGCD